MMVEPDAIVVDIPGSGWPDEASNALFAQWCLKLAQDVFGVSQWTGRESADGSFRFGDLASAFVIVAPSGARSWTVTKYAGFARDQVATLVTRAAQRAGANDTGEALVYQLTLSSPGPAVGQGFMLHMARILGDQKRIIGSRRLSDVVLLDFEEEEGEVSREQSIFVPDVKIRVTAFVPGPAAGELTSKLAFEMLQTVAAICAFALGRPVEPPITAGFPLGSGKATAERSRKRDPGILGLARDSVSLDIFGELPTLGGVDSLVRARKALVTLHEAQRQANADIAMMLYVGAIEALISPGVEHEWRKEHLLPRFRDGVLSLCTKEVDAILAHPNVEMAFGFQKQGRIKWRRRQLLDRIYDLRSVPTHTGIGMTSGDGVMHMAIDRTMRVALLSDLTRAAVLEYLQGPRCFITGQPALEQAKEALRLEKEAQAKARRKKPKRT